MFWMGKKGRRMRNALTRRLVRRGLTSSASKCSISSILFNQKFHLQVKVNFWHETHRERRLSHYCRQNCVVITELKCKLVGAIQWTLVELGERERWPNNASELSVLKPRNWGSRWGAETLSILSSLFSIPNISYFSLLPSFIFSPFFPSLKRKV